MRECLWKVPEMLPAWTNLLRPRESDARMDTDQAKWFLRVFAGGNKLNAITIRELYLSGYIGIELLSPGKEPLPTVITEKGKQVLES